MGTMTDTQTASDGCTTAALPDGRTVTVFLCANCARPGITPSSGLRPRPAPSAFDWPSGAREVLVPCTGRLQPEHLLKALEQGADAVCIIACDEANCHHMEGSCRAKRRAEFVGKLVEEIGLGAGRIMLFHLPGSAREDMVLGADGGAQPTAAVPQEELAARVKAIRRDVISRLNSLAPNPLRTAAPIAPADEQYEVEETNDSED